MRSISNRSSFMAADYISQWMRDDPSIPRFARVPAGEFSMGSDEGAEDERPRHRVQVDAFYASIYPITVEHYAEFTRETGHPVPGIRDLPVVVTPAHESSFRELSAPYVWRSGEPPRDRKSTRLNSSHSQ